MCNVHPLEIVGRGRETQLQVAEYLSLNSAFLGLNDFFYKIIDRGMLSEMIF